MLNDKQRETVRDYFRSNPNAKPQDIEKLLGFKMDAATVLETALLMIEATRKDRDFEAGVASGEIKVEFSMSDNDDTYDLTCRIAVKQVQSSKQDVETKLRAHILKKVMLALREELVGILENGDKMRLMIQNAEEELKKEWRTFLGKEGA